ncbi:MAG TPA: two-component sensor histidine kinase [Ruminococcus sp.]|nr:two-component sensor histidine kinase [Ruminococcus sp.]
MTIKKRLFLSNILMLIIPALVSILIIFVSVFVFANLFYKQFMDETVKENNLSDMHKILMVQSKEFLNSKGDITDSKLYHTVEKYLASQEMKLEISNDTGIICTIGNSDVQSSLVSAMESLGGEGSISANGACLYREKILVNGIAYHVMIYSSSEIQESQHNEFIVVNIILILCILIIAAVIITNQFLTKFVFRKIEVPLDILADGVHQIRDGNLDYRIIEYNEKDEFQSICNDFNDMAAKLKESVEITQKNEQNRKELIAGISHDLRTPLTSVKAYIEGLLEGVASTPQMQQKYMKIILAKANDIDRMVDKLFLFSKLDLGDCPFYPEKLNIRQEIFSIVSSNKKEYSEKGLNILCENIPADLKVYADPVQLRSAVTNILENSLKYKDSETVNVTI